MDVHLLRFAIPFITALVSGLFGLILVGMADVSNYRAKRSQRWPVTGGIVYQSDVEKHTQVDPEVLPSTPFEPVVQYRYTVDGRHYSGKRIFFGTVSTSLSAAREITSHYLPGMGIPVYYNPRNPAQSVLERRAPSARGMRTLGLGSLSIGLAASLLLGLALLSSIF